MTGAEFVRKLKDLARVHGVSFRIELSRGKGSHARIYFADKRSVIPALKREMKSDLFHAILKQLGLSKNELP